MNKVDLRAAGTTAQRLWTPMVRRVSHPLACAGTARYPSNARAQFKGISDGEADEEGETHRPTKGTGHGDMGEAITW
jgi:hypothetical protein